MIVEAAGNAPSTRTENTDESPLEASIRATIAAYEELRERVVAFVREHEAFLTESYYRSHISSLSAGNASIEILHANLRLEWLDYDYDSDPTSRSLSFPAHYLWDAKALARAKGHYELRQAAKAERELAEAADKERAQYERLKAKFEG